MTISRYDRTPIIGMKRNYGSARGATLIYYAVDNGNIEYQTYVTRQGDRLDSLAGKFYGDARYWWVIAAASAIGWNLQVPPGIYLRIPSIDQVGNLVG